MGAPLAATLAAPTVLTVHWSSPGAAPEPPSAAARRSLEEWAEARGVQLVDPRDGALAAVVPDLTVGEAVEEELERARDAITAQDATGADAAIAKAEALLHAHPELPQAAWLLAEVLRARSARLRRLAPRDAAASARAWAEAATLDGGRAGGVGENDAEGHVGPAGRPATAALAVVTLDGAQADDGLEVRLDGVGGGSGSHRLTSGTEGEHQVTVTRRRDGVLVWAGWVTLDREGRTTIALPHAAACSLDDLSTARLADGAVAAPGVLCADWVFVRAAADVRAEGALSIVWCSGERCGPLLRWSVGPVGPVLPERRTRAAAWPAWATWTILGASAAAVTIGTLAAAGVFRPTHDEPVFTTGGLHVSSEPVPVRGESP